jgi:hypothetical protein
MSMFVHTWSPVLNVGSCCKMIHTHPQGLVPHSGAVVWGNVYNLEGCRFNSSCCHQNFSLMWSLWLHYGPGVDSVSDRYEYQEYFLGVKGSWCTGPTTLPPLCAHSLEIWETPGTLMACPGLYRECFTLLVIVHPGQLTLQHSALCIKPPLCANRNLHPRSRKKIWLLADCFVAKIFYVHVLKSRQWAHQTVH